MSNNYYSLESLSSRTNDLINVYVIPLVNIYNITLYFFAILILSNKTFKGEINNLLLVFSLLGVVAFLMVNCLSVVRCGALCPWGYDYVSKLVEWVVYLYLGKSIELVGIFVEFHMLFIKLKAFSYKNNQRQNNVSDTNNSSFSKWFRIIAIYFVVSLLFYILPIFYTRSIVQIGYLISNETDTEYETNLTTSSRRRPLYILYKNDSKDFLNNFAQNVFPLTILLMFILIMILNTIIIFKLRSFIAKKTTIISSKFLLFLKNTTLQNINSREVKGPNFKSKLIFQTAT